MREIRIRVFAIAFASTSLLFPARAQSSHWASADDPIAKYIVDMERKWAEEACVDNGIVAGLLAEDFQGTAPNGARFTKADELKDEKGPHTAHDCGIDEVRIRFFVDSLALVYGSEHAVGKDQSKPSAKICQVWTDIWLKRNGTWQIVASQDNRVDCK